MHFYHAVHCLGKKFELKQNFSILKQDLRPAQTRKHCCGSKAASRMQKMFLEYFKNIFCFQDADFVSSTYAAVGAQTRKHLGNTKEALTSNASRLFPRLFAKATYLRNIKCFAFKTQILCLQHMPLWGRKRGSI